MDSIEQFREQFPEYYDAVKAAHASAPLPHRGHGLDHDVTVVAWALKVGRGRERVLAAIAALAHSSDRLIGREDREKVREFVLKLLSRLPQGELSDSETETIVEAVLRHSERNQPGSSLVLQILQDADKLAGVMPQLITRSGQFHPEIAALEFGYLQGKNPQTTFREPVNCLDNLRDVLEWREMFHSKRARVLAEPFFVYLEGYLHFIAESHKELGLHGFVL